MGNATPFIMMVGINLFLFAFGGNAFTVPLDTTIGDTLVIDQTNETFGFNDTARESYFENLEGGSGISVGTIFQTIFLVGTILIKVIVAGIFLPIMLVTGIGGVTIPFGASLVVGGILLFLEIVSIFLLVAGRN